MPEQNCIWVLAPQRSAILASRFLDHFLPQREATFAPEDPGEVLGLATDAAYDDVVVHLESAPSRGYCMIFNNMGDGDLLNAGILFNEDGSLFLTLSVDAKGGPEQAEHYLEIVADFAESELAYWGFEEPPPADADTFVERATRGR